MKRWVRCLLGLGAGLAIATLLGSACNIPSQFGVLRRGTETEGEVVGLFPKNHRCVAYDYKVKGVVYHREDMMGTQDPNPDFAYLHVGDKIVVYYDPEMPDNATPGYPGPIFWNDVISAGGFGLFIAFLIAVGNVRIRLSSLGRWWPSRRSRCRG